MLEYTSLTLQAMIKNDYMLSLLYNDISTDNQSDISIQCSEIAVVAVHAECVSPYCIFSVCKQQ